MKARKKRSPGSPSTSTMVWALAEGRCTACDGADVVYVWREPDAAQPVVEHRWPAIQHWLRGIRRRAWARGAATAFVPAFLLAVSLLIQLWWGQPWPPGAMVDPANTAALDHPEHSGRPDSARLATLCGDLHGGGKEGTQEGRARPEGTPLLCHTLARRLAPSHLERFAEPAQLSYLLEREQAAAALGREARGSTPALVVDYTRDKQCDQPSAEQPAAPVEAVHWEAPPTPHTLTAPEVRWLAQTAAVDEAAWRMVEAAWPSPLRRLVCSWHLASLYEASLVRATPLVPYCQLLTDETTRTPIAWGAVAGQPLYGWQVCEPRVHRRRGQGASSYDEGAGVVAAASDPTRWDRPRLTFMREMRRVPCPHQAMQARAGVFALRRSLWPSEPESEPDPTREDESGGGWRDPPKTLTQTSAHLAQLMRDELRLLGYCRDD